MGLLVDYYENILLTPRPTTWLAVYGVDGRARALLGYTNSLPLLVPGMISVGAEHGIREDGFREYR